MPLTLIVSKPEADMLVAHNIEGINGFTYTYEPAKSGAILSGLPKDEPAYDAFASRLAILAVQFGAQESLFAKPQAEPFAIEPAPEEAPQPVPEPTVEHDNEGFAELTRDFFKAR